MPKISIVTPCHNAERYVGALLESVRRQTFRDWEQIVVDDGSSDGSVPIVERFASEDSRVRVVRQAQGGVGRARNAGYTAGALDSRYVYFLDADDRIEPDMLETMVGYLDAHEKVGLAYCDYRCMDEHDVEVPKEHAPRYRPSRFGVRCIPDIEPLTPIVSIYCWAPVMESVSVLRRSVFDQTGGWDATLGQPGEGVDLFLRVALRSDVHFVNRPLYWYRRHTEQASADPERIRRQDLKIQAKWRDCPGLSSDDRRRIDDAQAFRTGRLRIFLNWRSARGYLRRGELRHAAHCGLDIVKTAAHVAVRRSPWPSAVPSDPPARVAITARS